MSKYWKGPRINVLPPDGDQITKSDIDEKFLEEAEEIEAEHYAVEVRKNALFASVTSFAGVEGSSDPDQERRILDRADVFAKYMLGES